jgi:acetyl esterase/lipase
MKSTLLLGLCLLIARVSAADGPDQTLDVWGGAVPGESELSKGETLQRKPNENPPATRIGKITQPTLEFYLTAEEKRNGTAVLIFPGGAYNYVVADKEGAEPARWLNSLGVTGIVLHYRTKKDGADPAWERPLQDAQRALSLVRSRTADWKLRADRIGVMGFSAGGNLGALAATRFEQRAYPAKDAIDELSCRPDFAMLIYPWKVADAKGALAPEFPIGDKTPPTFLVHTDDDSSTSLSSIAFYSALKQRKIPAELHIYRSGGHGYGLRPVSGSSVHTWTERAEAWLKESDLLNP